MNYPPPNIYNNISYPNRSQTMQPRFRGDALNELTGPKQFMINKYLVSLMKADSERANYANVQLDRDQTLPMQDRHQPSNQHHQHLHTRSRSQNHYHTMCHQVNDPNNYYNLNIGSTTIIPERARHHSSPMNKAPLAPSSVVPPPVHNRLAQFDTITIMQVCNELGNLDTSPPMPSPRNYTISGSKNCCMYKNPFPQCRYLKGQFTDPITGISIPPRTPVTVLCVSKADRSKFTVCYRDHHIDLPHQLTHPLQPHPKDWC